MAPSGPDGHGGYVLYDFCFHGNHFLDLHFSDGNRQGRPGLAFFRLVHDQILVGLDVVANGIIGLLEQIKQIGFGVRHVRHVVQVRRFKFTVHWSRLLPCCLLRVSGGTYPQFS